MKSKNLLTHNIFNIFRWVDIHVSPSIYIYIRLYIYEFYTQKNKWAADIQQKL